MEKILSSRKKIIKNATENEFYLNQRDIVINGKLENLNSFYLDFNSILAFIYDEFICFVDLLKSASNCLTFIKEIKYKNIYDKCFGVEKNSKNITLNCVNDDINFLEKHDSKILTNFICFENNHNIYICLQFLDENFLIIKYDDIRRESNNSSNNYEIIFKLKRSEFKNIFPTVFENKNINSLFYSSVKLAETEINEKPELNLICLKLFNYISLGVLANNKLKFEYTHTLNFDFYEFHVKIFNSLIFVIINTIDYNIIILTFSFNKNTFNLINEQIFEQSIFNNNNKMINHVNLFKNNQNNLNLIVCKINQIFIFEYSFMKNNNLPKNNFIFKNCHNIINNIEVIKFSFYIEPYILLFTSKNNYFMINEITNKTDEFSINILKEIYSIHKFKNDLGFYLIGTNNIFKYVDFNIACFLPKFLKNENEDILSILENKKNYSFHFHEFMIIFSRYFSITDLEEISSDILSNKIRYKKEIENILTRVSFYMTGNDNLKNEIKRFILNGNQVESNHLKYIKNKNFVCEMCNSVYTNYENRIYFCDNNHSTYSCSLTHIPLCGNSDKDFYMCEACDVIYSEKEDKKCLICLNYIKII